MPIFVLIISLLADYGFVMGRAAMIFYAIRLGADTGLVLLLGGAEGLVYGLTAWYVAGPLINRVGARTLIRAACVGMVCLFLAGASMSRATHLLPIFAGGGVCMALFWPSVHARLVERTAPTLLTRAQGVFNVTWTFAMFAGFATSGWLIETGYARGIGPWLGVGIAAAVVCVVVVLPQPAGRRDAEQPASGADGLSAVASGIHLSDAGLRTFALAGWVANFCSFAVYDAVRLVFPTIGAELGFPEGRMGLMIATAVGAQFLTFLVLTRWRGWLYRRRWFYGAYALHLSGLLLCLVTDRAAIFLLAFVSIGFALAFTYAASLFYGLGASATAGHSGGRHESMIGAARTLGPTLGAAAAYLTGSSRGPLLVYITVVIVLTSISLRLFMKLSDLDRRAIREGAAASGTALG